MAAELTGTQDIILRGPGGVAVPGHHTEGARVEWPCQDIILRGPGGVAVPGHHTEGARVEWPCQDIILRGPGWSGRDRTSY